MKKKYILGLCLMAALGFTVTACGDKEVPDEQEVLDEKELEEMDVPEPLVITDFNYYYDLWYKDGSLEETSLLLDEIGHWELYDSMGLYASGNYAIDTESNDGLLLLDETGESAAYVHVEGDDAMTVEVYEEDLMKLPQTSTFYRELASK